MSREGQFVAESIAFASTSLGAAKVRAAAISNPRFDDQEQENKMRGATASLLNTSILLRGLMTDLP